MNIQNKIVWQKWIDPFLNNINEIEIPNGDSDFDKPETDTNEYRDSYDDMQDAMLGRRKEPKKVETGPIMVGPMGIIPLSEFNIPSKIYCFWMGHTNFSITPTISKIIEKIPGVEALDVFSRYRFRLAIGKAFLSKEDPFGRAVLNSVSQKLCPVSVVQHKQEKAVVSTNNKNLNTMKRYLNTKHKFWVILELPDGTLDSKGGDSKEELLIDIQKDNVKYIATSW